MSINERLRKIEDKLSTVHGDDIARLHNKFEEVRLMLAEMATTLDRVERALDELVRPVGRAKTATVEGKLDKVLTLIGDEDV